jgi:hypothetical protein
MLTCARVQMRDLRPKLGRMRHVIVGGAGIREPI